MSLSSSLAARITSAFLLVTLITAACFLGIFYWLAVEQPVGEMRRAIAADARNLVEVHAAGGNPALVTALSERRRSTAAGKKFDALISADGRLLAGNIPTWPRTRRGKWLRIEADQYREGGEDDYEALVRDVLLPDGNRLLVGSDVEPFSDRKELMVEAATWSSLAIVVFGLVGGLLISWITGRRLDAVSRTARAIMDGDLSVRVPVRGTGDDVDRLGITLNAMLSRNEELVASLGRVSDNIAHELRTPLARMRSYLERLSDDAGPDPKGKIVGESLGELDRIQNIFDALLRIARLDTKRHRLAEEDIRLDELIRDAVEFYAVEADARGQTLSCSTLPCIVAGDRDLLFQALANLLDNAVKFTPDRGRIEVTMSLTAACASVRVADSGRGIAVEHKAKLGERFFRAPGAEGTAGTGLGLALTHAIVNAHQGTLSFPHVEAGFAAEMKLRLVQGTGPGERPDAAG